MTRHDWGPVAFSLGLRLAFLGMWISLEFGKPTRTRYFIAGSIVGVALFEKLSAVVLLLPFCVLLLSTRKRLRGAWIASTLGIAAGSTLLLAENLVSYWRGFGLVSFAEVRSLRAFRLLEALDYAREYLALGQGAGVRGLVFGDYSSFSAGAEVLLILVPLLITFLDFQMR